MQKLYLFLLESQIKALESDLIAQVQAVQVASLMSWQVSTFYEGFREGVRLYLVAVLNVLNGIPAPIIKVSSVSFISGHESGWVLTCPPTPPPELPCDERAG